MVCFYPGSDSAIYNLPCLAFTWINLQRLLSDACCVSKWPLLLQKRIFKQMLAGMRVESNAEEKQDLLAFLLKL